MSSCHRPPLHQEAEINHMLEQMGSPLVILSPPSRSPRRKNRAPPFSCSIRGRPARKELELERRGGFFGFRFSVVQRPWEKMLGTLFGAWVIFGGATPKKKKGAKNGAAELSVTPQAICRVALDAKGPNWAKPDASGWFRWPTLVPKSGPWPGEKMTHENTKGLQPGGHPI